MSSMLNMSSSILNNRNVRNRKLHEAEGPPVPPKSRPRPIAVPDPRPPVPLKDSKHQHHVPYASASHQLIFKELPPKPLPEPPLDMKLKFRNTLLWLLAFFVWFLLTVILLPLITERDAMPGFNQSLKRFWRRVIGSMALGEEW